MKVVSVIGLAPGAGTSTAAERLAMAAGALLARLGVGEADPSVALARGAPLQTIVCPGPPPRVSLPVVTPTRLRLLVERAGEGGAAGYPGVVLDASGTPSSIEAARIAHAVLFVTTQSRRHLDLAREFLQTIGAVLQDRPAGLVIMRAVRAESVPTPEQVASALLLPLLAACPDDFASILQEEQTGKPGALGVDWRAVWESLTGETVVGSPRQERRLLAFGRRRGV
jgi:hypothetical protein